MATRFGAVAASFGRDVNVCLDRIEGYVAEARRREAQMVVFPECALGGYPGPGADRRALLPRALRSDGPEIRRLSRIAGSTVVCAGFVEDAPGGPYNSAVCVTGDGVLGIHRKVHLPPSEIGHFSSGAQLCAFETPVGRVGMLICYDKSFPEAARALALDGAVVIASLAAWPLCRVSPARRAAADVQTRHFDILDRARAIENQVVWVSSNLTGRLGDLRFPGRAKVIGPDGEVRASTRGRSGVAVARIDLTEIARARATVSHLGDRRPGVYATPAGADMEAALAATG